MVTYDCNCKDITITEGIFGEVYAELAEDKIRRYDDKEYYEDAKHKGLRLMPVKSYTMINKNRLEITVISWGATIVSLKCPDKFGHVADIVLGFDDLKSYTNPKINPFIGCILGRCANRIRDGSIVIKDKTYQLTKNDLGKHHLHGGTKGFGRRLWESHIDACSVVMTYLSEDGEEGYPGAVLTTVRFRLTPDNKLEIGIRATTTNSTIVNISHGSLFNLAGHDAGKEELMKHRISLNCDRWTFADYTDPIPTGGIRGVGGTVMDLRIPRLLETCIEKVPPGEGYDHNFCITPNWHGGNAYVARAVHLKSGRVLEIYSNQPGVQFYTGGRLCDTSEADGNIAVVYDNPNGSWDNEEEYEKGKATDEMEQDATPERELQEFDEMEQDATPERELQEFNEMEQDVTPERELQEFDEMEQDATPERELQEFNEMEQDVTPERELQEFDEMKQDVTPEHESQKFDEMRQDVISERKSQEFISGKQGARYMKHCAFSIQPQNYPNAINYSHFPCSILRPGEIYSHDIIYKFGIQLANYM